MIKWCKATVRVQSSNIKGDLVEPFVEHSNRFLLVLPNIDQCHRSQVIGLTCNKLSVELGYQGVEQIDEVQRNFCKPTQWWALQ